MPETRQSRIDDPVLLNPVYAESRRDLIGDFQRGEKESLASMRGKGKAVQSDGGSGTESGVGAGVEIPVVEGGRPRRASAKRAMEGFPKKTEPKDSGGKRSKLV